MPVTPRDVLDETCDLPYLLEAARDIGGGLFTFLASGSAILGMTTLRASQILALLNLASDQPVESLTTLDWQRILTLLRHLAQLEAAGHPLDIRE